MKLVELTRAQERFLARETIVAMLEELAPAEDLNPLETESLTLAREDLEDARRVMEEEAAFAHVMGELAALSPDATKRELQMECRALIAHPDKRRAAAEASGVYRALEAAKS